MALIVIVKFKRNPEFTNKELINTLQIETKEKFDKYINRYIHFVVVQQSRPKEI